MKNKLMPAKFRDKLHLLTKTEQKYFKMMWPKYMVLYIQASPGTAKSSIARGIAEKMDMNYIDLRLSQKDETDLGLYPIVSEVDTEENGTVKCLDFAKPRWALEANKRPTIIHFEELNRSSSHVRNAALEMLLERTIGGDFKFNDEVLMLASGNLGDEDNTDVEEFDSALNNRLIHVNHELSSTDWLNDFAKDNVHELVRSYIASYPDRIKGRKVKKDSGTTGTIDAARGSAYATARSWTGLSEYILANYGESANLSEYITELKEIAPSYVGVDAVAFGQYCEDRLTINIHHVYKEFDKHAKNLKTFGADRRSALLMDLRGVDIDALTESNLENIVKFFKLLNPEEVASYLVWYMDDFPKRSNKTEELQNSNIVKITKKFPEIVKKLTFILD